MADNLQEPQVSALDALNPRQRLFVLEYLKDRNGTQAAIRAGYGSNPKSSRVRAAQLLANLNVRAAVDEEVARLREKYRLDVERILQELSYIGLLDVKDAYKADGTPKDITEMPESITRAIASVELEEPLPLFKNVEKTRTKTIKFHDKVSALRLAGLHFKMFTEKREVGVSEDLGEMIRAARERNKPK